MEDLTAIEGVDEETAAQMIELARKHEQVDETEGDTGESDEDEDEEEATEDEDTEEASDEQQARASVE